MAARRLLLLNSLFHHRSPPSSSTAAAVSPPVATAATETDNTFDSNVVMVLSVLLCALIISLGLNSIIRCAFIRFSRRRPPPPAAGQQLPATGIKKKALKTFPIVTFSSRLNNMDDECVICLSEFVSGDRVKILPKCNHGFHVKCIDKWLGDHSSCPTCRHCLIETCRKIVAGQDSSSSTPSPAAGGVVIGMPPMEAEGPVREHRIFKSMFFWRKN